MTRHNRLKRSVNICIICVLVLTFAAQEGYGLDAYPTSAIGTSDPALYRKAKEIEMEVIRDIEAKKVVLASNEPISSEEKAGLNEEGVTEAKHRSSRYDPEFHGYYRHRQYLDSRFDRNGEHDYEVRQDLRLEVSQALSNKLRYLVSLDGQYDVVHGSDGIGFYAEDRRARLWEAYTDYRSGNFNVRLGKQAIRWGKGDEVNPTDNFTPEDLTEFINLTRAERKIPVWMLNTSYGFEPYRLEGIWLPFFVPSRLPQADSDWVPAYYRLYRSLPLFEIERPDRPPDDLRSQVAAVKFIRSTYNYDASLSYAYHYNEIPYLEIDNPLTNAFGIPYLVRTFQRFDRQHTIGSDFETVIGKVGLRGELAYTFDEHFLTYPYERFDGVSECDMLNGVVGGDYTFRNNAYVNLQYAAQFIPDYAPGVVQKRYNDSVILKLSKKFWQDALLLELQGRSYLRDLDYYYSLKCAYDVTDWLKFTIGYSAFCGDVFGIFGEYKTNDQFFAEVRISF